MPDRGHRWEVRLSVAPDHVEALDDLLEDVRPILASEDPRGAGAFDADAIIDARLARFDYAEIGRIDWRDGRIAFVLMCCPTVDVWIVTPAGYNTGYVATHCLDHAAIDMDQGQPPLLLVATPRSDVHPFVGDVAIELQTAKDGWRIGMIERQRSVDFKDVTWLDDTGAEVPCKQ